MDKTNEEQKSTVDNGLNQLPEKEQKETKEILAEIEGETARASSDKKEETPVKPEEKKPEDGKTPDAGKKPEGENKVADDAKKAEPRREMKLVPAWVLESERSNWAKREKELLDAATNAAGKKSGEEGNDKAKNEVAPPDLDKAAEALAEKHNITPELAKDLIVAARAGQSALPPEVVEKLKVVDRLNSEAEITAETIKYNGDFERLIVPLIKAEYGNDVPPEVITSVQEQLKELAYNPDFAKVPYQTLYKGEDRFRGLSAPPKRGVEAPGGLGPQKGPSQGEDGKPDLSGPLTDAQIRALSSEEFDTWSANMERLEGKNRR